MQRLRANNARMLRGLSVAAILKKKTSNSLSAIQDTFLLTKEIFEQHRVVFTVGTSIASVMTAWAGYSMRYLHDSKVEKKLEKIERAMSYKDNKENDELRKMLHSGDVSLPSCVATAGTTLFIGYVLGWRSGRWFTERKFHRQQLKMLGQMKPSRWSFLRKTSLKQRLGSPLKIHAA